ncbi:PREDICTED: uncharacterized protein LOC104708063 [Camelina sativa]|uniref:Uncharacterized protein LOC104708063 n=1 Tax=Camelina sativa TaxID=90675 RepID=A0ABM0T9D5_CAMSA|nr:PREDICTED: uncharacterized protein LOC104708063 [Camelina sativa]
MRFKGNKFTWRRGRVVSNYVAKRLDKVLCCAQTHLRWHEATVTHLPFLASDHAPVYVQLSPEFRCDPRRRPFRFEVAWLSHPEFKDMLTSSCDMAITTQLALQRLTVTLKKLNHEVFGDIQRRKEHLSVSIIRVQDQPDVHPSDILLSEEEGLIKELELVLEQEEVLWFQKSREKWIALGERNTKYFHTSTIIRRRKNMIEMLKMMREAGSRMYKN